MVQPGSLVAHHEHVYWPVPNADQLVLSAQPAGGSDPAPQLVQPEQSQPYELSRLLHVYDEGLTRYQWSQVLPWQVVAQLLAPSWESCLPVSPDSFAVAVSSGRRAGRRSRGSSIERARRFVRACRRRRSQVPLSS